ncbi:MULTISPECIES: toll/interleukin-1 receptor domain-containing protein [unclassified Leeuwenhoekiella]|uniref:toll/interleukin-1 receptor domain-containing protein n=1 Tax=unclassified Leeuwenhoekiella TaxID=2615029 RepID=UPI000C51F799|nr:MULTISPECIES: toll/interleukin-1 receptor domain-containing protein [unclassified Leeuwenhoekiella]MAW95224.1 hypothetical protein [Leeuwenhoekiella sp.]MBA81853.1 hypothetical protein [Leeuwenhoekiella sp.]
MNTGTIFFSYSRQDSDFVIHLAQSLREAGAKVWLDQLDIQPGSRWDKSIEQALFKSSTLLVILSKASVESANVMDEVSFALEEKKRVVPILLEECDIPFRLRRLQFADFTGNRNQALNTLIASLGLEDRVASKLSDTAADHNLIDKVEDRPSVENTPQPDRITSPPTDSKKYEIPVSSGQSTDASTSNTEKKSSKTLLYGTLAVVALGIAIWSLIKITSNPDADKQIAETADETDWKLIQNKTDAQLFEAHIKTFNPCDHLALAQTKLDSLKPKPEVVVINEPEPEPEPTPEELALAEEQKKWEAVKLLNQYANYLNFYKTHPDSEYRDKAREELLSSLDKSGYVYYGSKYSNYFDPAFEEEDDGIPKANSFYAANATRTIRGSSEQGTAAFNTVKGSVRPKSLVLIEEVIESGSSYWVKIKFSEDRFVN